MNSPHHQITVLSYTQAGILTTELPTNFTVIEARNPCLRIGDVMRSVFIFSSFSLICQAKLLNLQSSNFNF